MLNIYQILFGVPSGQAQVQCCFHDDNKASAGISPSGQYNCFTCGAKAANELGFIKKFFKVSDKKAQTISKNIEKSSQYTINKNPLTADQIQYLHNIGLNDNVINKNFTCLSNGKLVCLHMWKGTRIGYTWFNNPSLNSYNPGEEKYKYSSGTIGGLVTPMDTLELYNTILICEGEKDMLTLHSLGFYNAVSKLGGAKTPLLMNPYFEGKNIILCYDCDEAGKEGMDIDATNLITEMDCTVKKLDLGLQEKEDINDFFMKYKYTKQDFINLISNTQVATPNQQLRLSRVERFIQSCTDDEINELKKLLQGGKEND